MTPVFTSPLGVRMKFRFSFVILFAAITLPLCAQWTAPVIVLPEANSTLDINRPMLRWNSQRGGTDQLQVSEREDFASVVISMNIPVSSDQSEIMLSGLESGHSYYVRMRSRFGGMQSDWTQPRAFNTNDNSSSAPVVVAPADGALQQATRPLLQWKELSGAHSYDVEVSPMPQFSVRTFHAENINASSVESSLLSPAFRYYWRVRAHFDETAGPWSAIFSFSTGNAAIAPLLALPANDAPTSASAANFEWQPSPGALSYHLQIAHNSTFDDLLVDVQNITTTTHQADLDDSPVLFWRVSAVNAIGEGTFSAWRTVRPQSTISTNAVAQLLDLSVQPTPAATFATVHYTITGPGEVSIKFRDINGNELIQRTQGHADTGTFDIPIDISQLPLGVYSYTIGYNGSQESGRLLLIR